MNESILEQVTPHGDGRDVASEVCKDINQRAEVGELKYGERLSPNNGRDALIDLYQEILDSAMYLKQLLMEREKYMEQLLVESEK